MSQRAIIGFCWITLGLTALVMLGGAAIGAAYHPDKRAELLLTTAAPLVAIAGLLVLLPRTRGIVWGVTLLGIASAGVALVGFFAYRLAVDGGDAVLWTPPMLLGLGLLALVLGLGRAPEERSGP